mmetsp:Transcript_25814/g.49004  ORF Transcript_25814/g.49004 Transcript_25814/m.49004 type:complete len:563 (-) Transcript_25814:352-2040(-)
MKRSVLLLLAACLVILGLSLSQTFHDMLPHTVSGDGHITRVVHSGANYGTYLPQAHTQSHGAAMSDNSLLPRGSTQQSPRPLPANKHPQSKDHPMPVNMATPRSVVPLGGQEPIHSDGLKDSTNLLRRNPEHGVNAVDHEESERPLLKTSRRGAMDEMLDDVDSHPKHVAARAQPLEHRSRKVPTSEDVVEHTHSSKASPRSHRVHGVASSASQTSQAPCDTDEECGLHGGCRRGHCVCSVFYTGPRCEATIKLPDSMQVSPFQNFSAAFDGSMVLNQEKFKNLDSIQVHLPGKEMDADKGFRTLADKTVLTKLLPLLPQKDVLMSNFYETCAIVGSSGIVLNYEDGVEIDAHDMVFRFNSAPTRGYEKHVGRKTTHRITNTQNWGFHESEEENLFIHFRATSSVKGIFWNGAQKKPWKMLAFDPDLVEYIGFGMDFMATSGLYGILIAMHRCARVDLYGFQVSTEHGTLYHYYDVCDVPANVGRDGSEYLAVKALAEAGLVHFAEPCIIECHNDASECARCKQETHFKQVKLPSDAKCDPHRKSLGHQELPWRRHRGHGLK